MGNKQNILIVENQFWQFQEIRRLVCCSENYAPIPNFKEQDKFIEYIDNIRVWVNEQYDKVYREKAFDNIIQIVNDPQNSIELILMDHILGGSSYCHTGIDLAFEINKKRQIDGKKILPVVFFSKTSIEDEKREKGFFGLSVKKSKGIEEYEKEYTGTFDWVHKGYFGNEILNPEYFAYVILKIGKVIGQAEEVRFFERLNQVIKMIGGAGSNQMNRYSWLEAIKKKYNYENLNENFKNMINLVIEKGDYSLLNDNIINEQLNA